jgi:hypothetical protein
MTHGLNMRNVDPTVCYFSCAFHTFDLVWNLCVDLRHGHKGLVVRVMNIPF